MLREDHRDRQNPACSGCGLCVAACQQRHTSSCGGGEGRLAQAVGTLRPALSRSWSAGRQPRRRLPVKSSNSAGEFRSHACRAAIPGIALALLASEDPEAKPAQPSRFRPRRRTGFAKKRPPSFRSGPVGDQSSRHVQAPIFKGAHCCRRRLYGVRLRRLPSRLHARAHPLLSAAQSSTASIQPRAPKPCSPPTTSRRSPVARMEVPCYGSLEQYGARRPSGAAKQEQCRSRWR